MDRAAFIWATIDDERGSLADLLEELPPDVAIDIDVKTSLEDALRPRDPTTAALVADLVRRAPRRSRVLVTSFDPAALLIVRERAPGVPVGLLTWMRFPLRKAIPAAVHLGADVVAVHVASFAPARPNRPRVEREAAWSVRVAHRAGLELMGWCPTADEVDALVAAGVDCLVVDDVPAAVARRARGRVGGRSR